GGAHAGLHCAHRLAVGVPGLEPVGDQASPDVRELVDPCTEHVDALPAGDLRVQAEVLGDLTDGEQAVRGDLPAGDAWHHRVGAVPLHVGQHVVVGVLQGGLLAVEDVPVAQGGQDGGDHRSADVTATVRPRGRRAAEPGDDLG